MDIKIADFQPINTWILDLNSGNWTDENDMDTGVPRFIIDETTKRRYTNESSGCVRFKCFLLVFGTPIVHSLTALFHAATKIFNLVTLYHFWVNLEGDAYNFKGRLENAGNDLLNLIILPLSIVGLELSAIFGVLSPYDGRKLYASIERAAYGDSILAPCFQPDAQFHLFGGNINERDVF